ncbi:unnamed protein product [Cylindrotheca closterium]|uniref:Uncharacterized protein n=1 Tax=Cylindrotheca closterium TaxID=2856 RepID=A0AAD2CN62_9STRA|nr:unnamed protein product [Cylindrotheca closterium]
MGFDSKQWPPTKQGLKDLLHHLKLIGLKHGSEFTYDASKGWLTCYRSKPYKGTKLQDLEQFNVKGVLLQYRHKSYHHDCLRNRPDGQTCPRATHTSKGITGDKLCSCRLRLRIHSSKKEGDQSYIYISCKGDTLHKYHAKPAAELPIKAHNLTAEARQIVCAQQKAAVTGTQFWKMLLELKHGYVSRSATRSVMITSPEYIAAKAADGANSSAADFIQWLQTQAGNPEVNLHYTVLSYEMTPTHGDLVQGTISNPKGRRSKTNPPPNTKTVMRNLTYSNTLQSPVPGDKPVATSYTPSISADTITQREDLHAIVQPTNVANLNVDKLVEGNSMVSRDRNRSLFILAQQHKQQAKVLSHFSQSRPNKKATPTKDKTRKPTPLPIVSPPPMGPGGLAAMRQAVHAAAAPMTVLRPH